MPQLIKDGEIVDDAWQWIEEELDDGTVHSGQTILPMKTWLSLTDNSTANNDRLAVWIAGDTDLSEIGQRLSRAPLIAVRFPGFMDGRGFSTGRLLRERYQFDRELRAVGHIIRDQLCYLRRCGFNAFQLQDGMDLQTALASLNDFQEYYQSSVDQPLPLFRRRTL